MKLHLEKISFQFITEKGNTLYINYDSTGQSTSYVSGGIKRPEYRVTAHFEGKIGRPIKNYVGLVNKSDALSCAKEFLNTEYAKALDK